MLQKVSFQRPGAIPFGLLLCCCFGLSGPAQVITFSNKTVTFITLEGAVYRNVSLRKADLYGITWGSGASGGRIAYTNLAPETLDSWGVQSNHPGRLAAQESLLKSAPRPVDPVLQNLEQDNVREVAFKTLIYEAAAAQHGYRVYFLSLGNTWTNDRPAEIDPSDDFMKRFAGRAPPIRKVSQSRIDEAGEVRDKTSGQRGVIFTVTDLKWTSDREVTAKCIVFKAGLSAYVNEYKLTRKYNQWKVTDIKLVSIS